MTITYADLSGICPIIEKVMDKNLPITLGHKIQRNFKKLNEAFQEFEQSRSKLMEKYGERDENDNLIVDKNQRVKIMDPQAFEKEFSELLDTEVEVPLDTFSFKALEDMEISGRYDSITPREQAALDIMIEEEME